MKKSVMLGAALYAAVACGTAFAQESVAASQNDGGISISFSNELGSDVVNITE